MPTKSLILALHHLIKSPPLPQPISRTLPAPRAGPRMPPPPEPNNVPVNSLRVTTGCAWLMMRTLLTQLLKFFRPMMGESFRCARPTSGRALSMEPDVSKVPDTRELHLQCSAMSPTSRVRLSGLSPVSVSSSASPPLRFRFNRCVPIPPV